MKDKEEEKGTEALAEIPKGALAGGEMTGAQMRARLAVLGDQKKAFGEFLKQQMKPGEHFYSMAEIQGREKKKGDKDVLNKAGSALLANLFMTYAGYKSIKEEKPEGSDSSNAHYTITVTCALYLIANDRQVAEGVGSCTTLEAKFAYRWLFESDVPKDLDKSTLKVQERTARKTGKPYKMFRVDNEELGSLHNTILKMAKKRAKVDATLDLPFASEIFTQDLEEIHEEKKETESKPASDSSKPSAEAPAAASESQPESSGDDKTVTGPRIRKLQAKFRFMGFDDEARHALLKEWYPDSDGHVFDEKSGKWLTLKQASELIETFESGPNIITKWLKDFQEKQGK